MEILQVSFLLHSAFDILLLLSVQKCLYTMQTVPFKTRLLILEQVFGAGYVFYTILKIFF